MDEQDRTKSITWWVGLIDAIVVAVVGILTTAEAIPSEIGASIIAGSAIILAHCNGNNPSIRGKY